MAGFPQNAWEGPLGVGDVSAARVKGAVAGAAGQCRARAEALPATPDQIALFARRSARALAALGLLGLGSGGAVLWGEAAGLFTGAAPDALWLVACGLIAAALAAVSTGLSRAARRVGRAGLLADLALVTLHGPTGEFLAVEHAQAPCAGLGLTAASDLFDRIQVADRPAFLAALSSARAGEGEARCEVRLRCEGAGETPVYVWMEMRAVRAGAARRDGGPLRTGIVRAGLTRVSWRDIDAAKLKAEREEAARAEAERANHAKSRFLAAMSHELRTPLNTILGYSELLASDGAGHLDATRRADYARIIHESGQHLLGLVNDILDLSRVEAGAYELSPEPLEVAGLVDGCLEMMSLEAVRRGVALKVRVAPRLPSLCADHRALRQILLNLLSNAVKFTPRDGKVELSVRERGGTMSFCVRDTGPGMSASDVARLGEPFFQTGDMEHRRAGSGLGLAVVRGLVLLHGGSFHVASTKGRGTAVTITIPLVRESGVVAFARADEACGAQADMRDGRRSA
ncbi:HAMP domain-containing histidine kinase [Aquabacter sp. L1I39]|uniref:sensor histidine kinase n=1 Tax=Aquabacter sp. L1I39 TaxID=2820278 RepID=UPI001AD9FCDF|nr:HAMP domain-containing sensor histidine kinase [Aquabacter sp. L1I39]QTL04537.1 HAMP domain-containing histidine kinase [Aquabacter sp. L1I39]